MKAFSEDYTNLYDAIHHDKNYQTEINKLKDVIRNIVDVEKLFRILDFGCGTGSHVKELSKNYATVAGYDPNYEMIQIARNKCQNSNFYTSTVNLDNQFDLVISLFDVINYQTTSLTIRKFFDEISRLIKKDGHFIIQGWHKSGVSLDPPTNRQKVFKYKGKEFFRRVIVNFQEEIAITNLKIEIIDQENKSKVLSENHILKSYSQEEIKELTAEFGLKILEFRDGTDWHLPLKIDSWRFLIIGQKIE